MNKPLNILAWMLLMVVPIPVACWAAEQRPPNVVFILSDDQAWTDYGFMGHPTIRTPNLDRLAAQSAVFPRGYVPTALCRPSLATMITGLYAHQHGLTGNDPSPKLAQPGTPAYDRLRSRLIDLIDQQPTLPRWLAGLGYLSHQSGKWWEGSYLRGGFTHGMTRGFPEPGGRHGDDGLAIGREGLAPVFDFIDLAVAEDKPFYLWYAPFMPHSPHNPPPRLLEKYADCVDSIHVARYYAMCEWFDETVGQLVERVEQVGLAEKTLFIYVCDNGWIQSPDDPRFAPRSKQSPYEGGVRQPMLLRWDGVIAPDRYETLVSSVDIVPTILAAAGIAPPADLPGINLLPLIRDGQPIDRDTIFGEAFAHDIADLDDREASLLYRWAIRDRWKLILTYDGQQGRHAIVQDTETRGPQLFDLIADPHEQRNLAAEQPAVVAELARTIADWWPVRQRKTITAPESES